jgi:hypothetical protein
MGSEKGGWRTTFTRNGGRRRGETAARKNGNQRCMVGLRGRGAAGLSPELSWATMAEGENLAHVLTD